MKNVFTNSRLKNTSVRRVTSLITLLTIFLSSSFLIPSSNNITEIDQDFNNFSQTPLLADNVPVLFEGNENALNVTEYGNLYDNNQEVTLTDQEELNLTYYLDDVHDWKVSKIETQISKIEDTREWVENNDYTDVITYRVNVSLSNIQDVSPPRHNYTGDLNRDPTNPSNIHSEIIQSNASLIRVHFSKFEIEEDWDVVCFYDEYNVIQYTDTGKKVAFFSPWIKTTHIKITMDSDGTVQWYGYDIDYYEYINDSLDYYESFDHWGYNNGTIGSNFGSTSAENETAMYVSLVGEPDRDVGETVSATYYENDFSEVYQNLTIPRGQIIDGYISFDYYAEFAMDSNENSMYCEINNKRIYSKGIGDIVDAGRRTWLSTGEIYLALWSNTSSLFEEIQDNQEFNISVGIMSGGTITYSGFNERFQQVFWFDNLSLVLITRANSSQSDINLKLDGFSLNQGTEWGESSLNITSTWNTDPVVLTVNTTSPSLSFDLDTNLYGYHETTSFVGQTTVEGVSYEILENGTIYWEFSHNFYMPGQYSDFDFTIDKPENWNFISALDPTLQEIPFEDGKAGDATLKINTSYAIFPGWWTFRATSPNYLNQSNIKLLKQGEWTHTSFNTGESTRIKTQVNYSSEIPSNIESTEVNLTIFDPEGHQWYSEVKSPLSNGSVFFSELYFDALNTTGGQYDYTLFWSNGTSLGGLNSSFLVTHQSSFSLIKPNDAISDSITDAFVGDIIPVRVNLKDSENNDFISNAAISYNWTGGSTQNFTEAALGIYEAVLDTSDLGSNGFYEILIESSKVGFLDYNLTLKINLGEETNVQRLQSDYNIELHANSTIKFRYYSLLDDEGINGADVDVNISNSDFYSINNSGNGYYDIEFDTLFTNNLGIFQLNFNFSAPAFEPQTHIYQFEIVEQSVNITAYVDNVEIQRNSIIDITYMEEINISTQARALIDDDLLTGGNFTWKINSYEQSLNEYSSFWYNTSIQINPSIYSPGLNLIGIQFEMEKYKTEIFYFQLLVYEQPVNLSVFVNSQLILENDIFEITYMESFNISVKAFATFEADYINGALIKWQGGNQEKTLIEVGSDWYNTSIQVVPLNYTPGLNSITIEFIKDNYQNKIFSFQLLVEEQSVDLSVFINSQLISEDDIFEIMYMESFSISVKAFATIEAEYINGALITWQGGNQEKTLIEVGSDWYNTSIQIVPLNYTPGLNSITIEFMKDNYQNKIFHFQLLVEEQLVDLSVFVNSQLILENDIFEIMYMESFNISVKAFATIEAEYINGAIITWQGGNQDKTLIEVGSDWYNTSIQVVPLNYTPGLNSITIEFVKDNYQNKIFSFQLLVEEQSVDLSVFINSQLILENGIFEIMYMESITISLKAFATIDADYINGAIITWQGGNQEKLLIEVGLDWYNTSIQVVPLNYSPGLNSITIEFVKDNYQNIIFSFQLLVEEQSVDLSVFINSQLILENDIFDIMYMESITISLKAFATIEAEYINGAIITWQGGNQEKLLIEVGLDWYNTTIQVVPLNYTPGLNSITIEFIKDNYQNKIFSFQLLVEEQSVDLSVFINSQLILENGIFEIMYMESITISLKAFATIDADYINGAIITWQGGNQEKLLIEVGLDWYNTTIQVVPLNYTPGLNSITIEFIKDNYQSIIFSFQLLVEEQSVDLSVFINSQLISEDQLVEAMFKQNITISARAYGNMDLNYINEAYFSWNSESYAMNFIEYGANWYNLSLTFSTTNFSSGINTVSIKFEKENYTTTYFSFQLLISEQAVQLNVSINSQSILDNALIEVMFKENVTIAAQAYAMGEGIFLSGGNITLIGEMFSFNIGENASHLTWFTTGIIIDGAYFDLGINTISIKFEQDNYTAAYFSFQFFITAETVNLSLYVDSQEIVANSLIEITYYDEFSLSLKALANVEKLFLDGGSVIFAIGSYNQDFIQYANYWYNTSVLCDLINFDLGINSVYVRFLHENYTSSTFYFQILVNQIEMNVEPIDFQDSIEIYSGESIVIRINLTELISANYIENTTISYSWEFGLGNFEEIGNGIYEIVLEIPDNIQGNFKVSLIISTENVLYKATQSSFLLVIGEPEFPVFIIWIIIGISAALISALGILSLRSYVILPHKRKKEAELLSRTQRFKDIQNIQAIVAIHRYSGIPLYSQSYSILEKHKKELFSGFVQAIITVGEEMVGKVGDAVESGQEDASRTILELDFKYFYCLICDREDLRMIFLLNERASDRLKKLISDLSMGIMLDLSELIENWDGAIHEYEAKLPPIIAKYVELYYKNPFKINDAKFIAKLRRESELESMETRLLNVMYSITKSKQDFYLERIFEVVHEKNQDIVIDAIETLIKKQIIIPSNK